MKKRILALLLIVVVISLSVGFAYVNAELAADDGLPPLPDDGGEVSNEPWPEETGVMPLLPGGSPSDQPLIYGQPSLSINKIAEPAVPSIEVWYENKLKFGQNGNPQQWINIIGNVTGVGDEGSLSYSLNGGSFQPLSIGSNKKRLYDLGDYNVEIDSAALKQDENIVTIQATDGMSPTLKSITFDYTPVITKSGDYDAVWNSSNNIYDIAQPVDGFWQLDGNSVHIDEDNWGYDRLLAIGDETWVNYEVTAPITVYKLDPDGNSGTANGPGVGFIMRWLGHVNKEGEQPSGDWARTGQIGWYRWTPDGFQKLELIDYFGPDRTNSNKKLLFDTQYIFKMSVQTIPDGRSLYRLKFWKADEPEPGDWDLSNYGSPESSKKGSLLLVAHHAEAKFGQVTVKNLDTMQLKVNVTVEGGGSYVFSPPQEDGFGYAQVVRVSAIPVEGHDFAGWSGDYNGMDNPVKFNMFKDLNLTANFKPKPPTKLKVSAEGDGTVTKEPNKTEYNWGEYVDITAVPSGSEVFLRWEGDVTGIQNPATIRMDVDKEVTAIFGPKSEATPRSDDFSGCVLNTDRWTETNPAKDATLEMNGTTALFKIPGGTSHNMWTGSMDALRIMQPTEDVNFGIEVKFEDLPTEKFQMEGILIQQDEDNWLRFDYFSDDSNLWVYTARNLDGKSKELRKVIANSDGSSEAYMRIERNGNTWTQSYSFDGENWIFLDPFSYELQVASTGVFVGNATQGEAVAPAFNANLDYFFNMLVPIEPEDQGNTINVTPVGQGQVDITPLKSTYSCGEKVTLTANADDEWSFDSWSGDLTGRQNPAILTISGDYEIAATFGQGVEVDLYLPSVMK